MDTRKTRAKRVKIKEEYVPDFEAASVSSLNDPDDDDEARKSKIRDSNKEFARRMTILQTWSEYWNDYTTREGDAYPQQEARDIIKRSKKITCPIATCGKSFTSIGGLKYHFARCKIERSFKCKVCEPPTQLSTRGELLRHMILIHYKDLPILNDDQKEIANSILGYDKGDKRDKKLSNDSEALANRPKLVKAYESLLKRIFLSDNFSNRPYKDWSTSSGDWDLISCELERRRYYPPELDSVNFRTPKQQWQIIKAGESSMVNSDDRNPNSYSCFFFTGGMNTASAWLPKNINDPGSNDIPEMIAVSVSCCSMDQNLTYKESYHGEGCIQFWSLKELVEAGNRSQLPENMAILEYMVGHDHGFIFDMSWCPLGTSWQPRFADPSSDKLSRLGLLAIAYGDGRVRIISVPYTQDLTSKTHKRVAMNTIEATPLFKVKPIATLNPPGGMLMSEIHATACRSICWNHDDNQRLIVAGYANGYVAVFDLANQSPVLFSCNDDSNNLYRPMKSWVAHGAPVTGVAISSTSTTRTFIATGSIDRQLKIWNLMDLNSCLATDRAPITRILWDFRFRGVITATDTAFTSFSNRVSYRYPVADGNHNITVSLHRSTVWGLSNSVITSAIATSDAAGEVFILPQLNSRSSHKRDRNLSSTHSIFSVVPQALDKKDEESMSRCIPDDVTNDTEVIAPETVTGSLEDNNSFPLDGDSSQNDRPIVNKPTKFLLPIEHHSIDSYKDFKDSHGLEFVPYRQNVSVNSNESRLTESCARAGDVKNIYCDRPCDYPFSSVNFVAWSPNPKTFSHLLSGTQVGLCRVDRIPVIEQLFRGFIDSILD